MVPDAFQLVAVVLLLFSLGYFSMASVPFLFVRLDIPQVWRLFRGLFVVYFWVVAFAGLVATTAFARGTHVLFAAATLVLASSAIALRKMVLARMDMQQTAWQSGDTAAMRRLRAIHWGAMLTNLGVLASVASSLPFIF